MNTPYTESTRLYIQLRELVEIGFYHFDGGGGMKPPEPALLAVLEGPNPSSFCKL